MNWNSLSEMNVVQNLGWTLIHSIWQFGAVALILWFGSKMIPHRNVNLRYAVSVACLLIVFALPVLTYWEVSGASIGVNRFSQLREASYWPDSIGDPATRKIHVQAPIESENETVKSDAPASPTFEVILTAVKSKIPVVLPFAVALWLLGVALFSLRLCGGIWQLRRLRISMIEPLDSSWQERFCELCRDLRVERAVKIGASASVATPIAVGIIKPMILVPAGLFLQIDPRQLESIIAHELIHIRRHDPLVSVIQGLAETLFFYHPCVWWISREIRREREFAADAAVVDAFADDRIVYATALANLEEIRLRANRATAAPQLASAADGGNLMKRIERILQNKTEIRSASSPWSAGLALMLISAVLLAVFSFTPRGLVNAQQRTGPAAAAKDRKIAIGFVSIPPVDRTENPPKDSDATARLLIAKLQQYKIPATGFVLGGSISDGEKLFPVRANIVRLWRDAGLEVGIGNFKHIWFYHTPYDEFVANVEKNETVVNKILAEKNLKLRYFSYPYLNTGKSVEERDRFEAWLGERGLMPVKYTVDNNEWMYSYAYDMARNDNDMNTMNEIRAAFVDYMGRMFDHYEAYSQETFGRDIAQTMVLTPSRLVTDSADELFGLIQKRGYKFVPMDEAQSDVAYKTPETMIGEFGTSWFDRWTKTQGRKLREEPRVDAAVWETWQKRKAAN